MSLKVTKEFAIIGSKMGSSERGRQIHAQAEEAREKKQDFLESLRLADEALFAYLEDGDYLGAAEVCGTRALALRLQAGKSNETAFLWVAKGVMSAAVVLARKSSEESAVIRPLFDLGKVCLDLEEYKEAQKYLAEAYEKKDMLPEFHESDSVRADMQAKFGFATAMSGEKQKGVSMINEAVHVLKSSQDQPKYNIDVWLSGAYMLLAQADQENAREHMVKAKEVIDSNPELEIRKQQWEKLRKKLEINV